MEYSQARVSNLQPAVQLICAYKASSRLLRAAQRRTKEVKAHDNQRCGSHPVERGQVLRREGAVRELRVPCPVRSRKELQRIQTNRPLIAPALVPALANLALKMATRCKTDSETRSSRCQTFLENLNVINSLWIPFRMGIKWAPALGHLKRVSRVYDLCDLLDDSIHNGHCRFCRAHNYPRLKVMMHLMHHMLAEGIQKIVWLRHRWIFADKRAQSLA